MSDRILRSSPLAAEAKALIDGLVDESARRYGIDRPGGARAEVERYPAQAFVPHLGDFLLLVRDGETIGGRAFMSHDDETPEIKRIWTHPAADLYVGLVNVPGAGLQRFAPLDPALELRRIVLNPPVNRRVVHRQMAFGHHLFEIAVAQRIAAIPAHA